MNRKWNSNECPDCGQHPVRDDNGSVACGCNGKGWQVYLTVSGTPEEQEILKAAGFTETKDKNGNIYYFNSAHFHIIELYSDGTWYSDKWHEGSTIAEYLKWLKDLQDEISRISQ